MRHCNQKQLINHIKRLWFRYLKDIANTRYEHLNIEQGISNDEVLNRYAPGVAYGYAPASCLLNIKDDRITYFDIHYSLFDILRVTTNS